MSYTDLAAQARSYSATAAAATRRAEASAHEAQRFYAAAARAARMAASLTRQSARWMPEYRYTPAEFEAEARMWARHADTYLRRSFSATDSATFYRELAARYRVMHAARESRMAS